MNNEINFLEYKKRKEKVKNKIITNSIVQKELINDIGTDEFVKYEKHIDWLVNSAKNKKSFKPINDSQITFFKWLLPLINDYCNDNYMDLTLFDENNYFYTLINLKHRNVYFSIKTLYYHNATEVEIIPFDKNKEPNKEDIIDLDWVRYGIKPPKYEEMKESCIEDDVKSLCELYEIDVDYLKNIISKIEKEN